jgi:GntR family transcriptional regulator
MAEPMYRQIAEDLRAQIESGELQPGQQLRTELELRERYGASRNTVRDAIKLLTSLGLAVTKPGQGTFVVQTIEPFVTMLAGDPQTEYGSSRIKVEIVAAPEYITAELRIGNAAGVISRHERRCVDSTPWSMQTSFYSVDFTDHGAERMIRTLNIDEETVRYLDDTHHMHQVGYRDTITVRAPNPTEVGFRLPADGRVPVYEIPSTAPGSNQFIIDIGDIPLPGRMRVSAAPRTERF